MTIPVETTFESYLVHSILQTFFQVVQGPLGNFVEGLSQVSLSLAQFLPEIPLDQLLLAFSFGVGDVVCSCKRSPMKLKIVGNVVNDPEKNFCQHPSVPQVSSMAP